MQYDLTEREKEILKLLCFSKEEIAQKLYITPSTVNTHRQNLYEKLCTHDKVNTLLKALDEGIITFDEIIRKESGI